MKKIAFIFGLLALLLPGAKAQTDSTVKKGPQFKLSLNYNSNLNYFGRTDSLRSSGIFPMAEVWVTPKFYINAAPIFVNNAAQCIDYAGTVATVGYQALTEKWLSNVYLMKPFYERGSQLVQSALKAQSGVSISHLNKAINLTIGGDVKFSDKVDFGATAGVDHLFRFQRGNKTVWVIDPSFYAYAGTQNFTNTYNKKKSHFLLFPGNGQQVTENIQKFSILAYEVSVPIIFARGKGQLLATPSYILPQNLITVPNRPDLSEKGKNTFYTTVGVKYSF